MGNTIVFTEKFVESLRADTLDNIKESLLLLINSLHSRGLRPQDLHKNNVHVTIEGPHDEDEHIESKKSIISDALVAIAKTSKFTVENICFDARKARLSALEIKIMDRPQEEGNNNTQDLFGG